MADKDGCQLVEPMCFQDKVLEAITHFVVESGEWLVEQKKLRAIDERAGERDALLLAAGKSCGLGGSVLLHANHGQSIGNAGGDFCFRRVTCV